jgi:hypothetical protein
MRPQLKDRWQGFRTSGRRSLEVLKCWRQHEWRSLQGHWYALLERAQLARSAPSVTQLVYEQIDLVPESLRRLRRNAETRRGMLKALVASLRRMVQAQA